MLDLLGEMNVRLLDHYGLLGKLGGGVFESLRTDELVPIIVPVRYGQRLSQGGYLICPRRLFFVSSLLRPPCFQHVTGEDGRRITGHP